LEMENALDFATQNSVFDGDLYFFAGRRRV
jgi:hypothetical protein